MKLSRRNVLAGLGGLAVGGGALLGSGAFSSVEATRDVQVNVLQDIANVEEAPDVLLNVGGYDEVGVEGGSGIDTDGSNFSPSSDIDLTSSGSASQVYDSSNWVSLVENDVTIVFGHQEDISGDTEHRLPPNATTTFGDLIALVQETDNDSDETDLAFGSEAGTSNFSTPGSPPSVEFVDSAAPLDSNGTNPVGGSNNYPTNVQVDNLSDKEVSSGTVLNFDVEVNTRTSDETAEDEFGIAIGDSNSVSDLFPP